MKNIYLKYTLLSVAITSSLLFTACGNKSETINEAPETTAVEETTENVIVEESDKAMNPDYNNPEEYAAEDYYDTEETAAESSDGSGLSYNVDILEMTAEGYKKDLEAGRITQETYDVLMGFLEEAEALADENGDFSLDEVYESSDAKNTATGSNSSGSTSYEYNPNSYSAQHGTKGVEGASNFERDSLDGYHDPDFAGYSSN